MKTSKNRLPAFTIIEMIISLLLTAIVMGITITAYQIISKSYISFSSKNKERQELIWLDGLLEKDFEKGEWLTFDGKTLVIQDSLHPVRYTLLPGQIIRQATSIDTFKVAMTHIDASFENNAHSLESPTDSLSAIDDLSFDLIFHKDTISCRYHKYYSSVNLLNHSNYADR